MPFDLAALAGSAVAGGLSGIAFASWKIAQEEATKRRIQAKRQVRAVAREQLATVIGYRGGFGGGREPRNALRSSDYIWTSKVLLAADDLGSVRKWLVRNRLKRLVGLMFFELAEAKPAQPDKDDLIATMIQARGMSRDRRKGSPDGLLDVALRQEPDSKDVAKLVRELKLLAKAR